jgi:hypothetical protein
MFTKRDFRKEMDYAEGRSYHYWAVAVADVLAAKITEDLNEAHNRGWRLMHVAGQKGTTMFFFERQPAGG